jgi:hypothetical protein
MMEGSEVLPVLLARPSSDSLSLPLLPFFTPFPHSAEFCSPTFSLSLPGPQNRSTPFI